MNDSLEQAIQSQWGRYGGWEPGRAKEFADILRASGITNLGDITNAQVVETPDAFKEYQGGNLEANDPGTLITRPGYQLQLGDKKLGFLGDIGRSGQFEGKQSDYLQETYDPNSPYRLGWSAQGKGNVSYNLVKGPDGKYVVVPQWGSSSDTGTLRDVAKGAMTIGSMAAGVGGLGGLGGAGSTFGNVMKGANALYNASQGNILGAITGAAGLGGEYLPEYASTFKNIGQAARGIGALQNISNNPLGSLYSLTSIGAERPELSEYSKTLKDIGGGINVARALGSGQYGAALTGLGQFAGEGDIGKGLSTAGTGLKLAQTAANLKNNPLAAVSLAQAGSKALSNLGSGTDEAKMSNNFFDPATAYQDQSRQNDIYTSPEDTSNDYFDPAIAYQDQSRQNDIYTSPTYDPFDQFYEGASGRETPQYDPYEQFYEGASGRDVPPKEPSFMDTLSKYLKPVNSILSGKSDLGPLGSLLGFGGLAALLKQLDNKKPPAPSGYQGNIPLYSMLRTQNQQPAYSNPWEAGATRRPGQGGVNYFSAPEFRRIADSIPAGYAGGIGGLPGANPGYTMPAEQPPARMEDMLARLSPEERSRLMASAPSSTTRLAMGGMPELAAKGRFIAGAGDGVSDHVPATIEGGQPARLADGEFVLPARIVSEIGNGSSAAGARKLYAFMDRVERMAKSAKRGKPSGADRLLNKLG